MAAKAPEVAELLQDHYDRALERYEEGQGDSDNYDSDEEMAMIESLDETDRAKYEEYKDIHIYQLVEFGRTMDVADEIRRHMFKWLPGVPEDYAERASRAVKKRRVIDEEGNVAVKIHTKQTEIPEKI